MAGREEFRRAVKEELAGRAGNRCSLPWCRLATSGPALRGVANTGVAAHLFSAAAHGPRGQDGLSPDQLRAAENGIWCCRVHGEYIDTHRGNGFDVDTLKAYRRLAETLASLEQHADVAPNVGWVDRLDVVAAPALAAPVSLRLKKYTLLCGPNGSGKSILADCLAGLGQPSRWGERAGSDRRFDFRISYFDPRRHAVDVKLEPARDEVVSTLDGERAIHVPRLAVVRWAPQEAQGRRPSEVLERGLHEDQSTILRALLTHRSKGLHDVTHGVPRDKDEKDGAIDRLRYQLPMEPGEIPAQARGRAFEWDGLSASERGRLGIEVAIAIARERSRNAPTLLIIDPLEALFDKHWEPYVLDSLSDPTHAFQTLVVTPDPPQSADLARWTLAQTREVSPGAFQVLQDLPLDALTTDGSRETRAIVTPASLRDV